MATNNQIKFYKGANAPSTLAAGMIWFCTSDRTIRVYTGSEWEKYAGLVDASWNDTDKSLTITSANGTTTTLDLSDCASKSWITTELQTINTNITNAKNAADAAQADVDALEKVVGEGFTEASTVATQLAAVKATADAAAVKTTVDAALADKADKSQVATDINTAKEAAIAAAAADATSKANAAEAAAKDHADGINTELTGKINAMDAAYKKADEEILDQIEDIVAAAVTIESPADDKYVSVVKAEGANKYTVSSKGIDDAIDVEKKRAEAAEQGLGTRIDALAAEETGRVSILEAQVAALNSATHFEGVVEFDPSAEGATTEGYESGDIVIYGSKEYIFDGTKWIELGDTTAESGRISALEGLVGNTSVQSQISTAITNALSGLSDESKDSGDANLIKVTVNQADGNVTGVVVDDTKLDEAFKSTNDAVALNTAAVADYKTRIEALEGTSNSLANTYVAKSDYTTDKQAFEQKHTDLQGEIDDAEGRLDVAESDIDNLQAGTGLGEAAAPVYTGANYIASSTTMVAADMALDAKIKELEDFKSSLNVGVTSVSGDADVNANPTTGDVSLSLNKATAVTSGDTKVVTSGAVYEAMCWVEFN